MIRRISASAFKALALFTVALTLQLQHSAPMAQGINCGWQYGGMMCPTGGLCCSQFGYCGRGPSYCCYHAAACQEDFGW
ncbi:MAG TPA: hypothetical protein VIN03_01050, partial [Roseateles sp.]